MSIQSSTDSNTNWKEKYLNLLSSNKSISSQYSSMLYRSMDLAEQEFKNKVKDLENRIALLEEDREISRRQISKLREKSNEDLSSKATEIKFLESNYSKLLLNYNALYNHNDSTLRKLASSFKSLEKVNLTRESKILQLVRNFNELLSLSEKRIHEESTRGIQLKELERKYVKNLQDNKENLDLLEKMAIENSNLKRNLNDRQLLRKGTGVRNTIEKCDKGVEFLIDKLTSIQIDINKIVLFYSNFEKILNEHMGNIDRKADSLRILEEIQFQNRVLQSRLDTHMRGISKLEKENSQMLKAISSIETNTAVRKPKESKQSNKAKIDLSQLRQNPESKEKNLTEYYRKELSDCKELLASVKKNEEYLIDKLELAKGSKIENSKLSSGMILTEFKTLRDKVIQVDKIQEYLSTVKQAFLEFRENYKHAKENQVSFLAEELEIKDNAYKSLSEEKEHDTKLRNDQLKRLQEFNENSKALNSMISSYKSLNETHITEIQILRKVASELLSVKETHGNPKESPQQSALEEHFDFSTERQSLQEMISHLRDENKSLKERYKKDLEVIATSVEEQIDNYKREYMILESRYKSLKSHYTMKQAVNEDFIKTQKSEIEKLTRQLTTQ